MMKIVSVTVMLVLAVGIGFADSFGTGANQFDIDFVDISGDSNPTSGYGVVDYNYRMGTYEVTNDQWNKFKAEYGTVTGDPSNAYDSSPYWTGTNVPTNRASWYEAAQFVNYLNTSSGYQAAYKFTGTQGTSNYALGTWSEMDAWEGENLYRHKDAHYFLPTEDEWVKAAYWNGSSIQTYATTDGSTPEAGVDSNYNNAVGQPWNVGSGTAELNGTYDMMGNVWEWMESPYSDENYGVGSSRGLRSGFYGLNVHGLASSYRNLNVPYGEGYSLGFRVASVPEPSSLILLSAAGMFLRKRRS
jgi:formylglycine-generating enzyme required for sulfatase activity